MRAVSRWVPSSAVALVLVAAAFATMAADTVSYDQLMHMIQTAKTPADHEAIAAVYEKQAFVDAAAAQAHRRLSGVYKGIEPTGAGRGSGQAALHCTNLAEQYARAARENNALADLHRKAATDSR